MLGNPPQKDVAGVVQFLQYIRWANQVLGHPKGRGLPTTVTSSKLHQRNGTASTTTSSKQHRAGSGSSSAGVISLSDLLAVARTCCDALSNGRILLSLLRKLIASTSDMATATSSSSLNTSTDSAPSGGVANVLANLVEVRRICNEIVLPECGIDTAAQLPLPTPEKLYSGNFESHCVLLHSIFYAFVVRVRLGSQLSPHRHATSPVDANAMLRSYRSVAQCFQLPIPLFTTNQATILEHTITDNFSDGSLLLLTIYIKQQRQRQDTATTAATTTLVDPSRIHLDAPVGSQERLHNWVYLFTVLEGLGLHNYFRDYLLPTAPIYYNTTPSTTSSAATAQEVHLAATTTCSATFLFMQAFYIFQVMGGVDEHDTVGIPPHPSVSPHTSTSTTTSKKEDTTHAMAAPHQHTPTPRSVANNTDESGSDDEEVVCVQMTPTLSRSVSYGGANGKGVGTSASSRGASVISPAQTPTPATTTNPSLTAYPASVPVSVSGGSRGPSVRTALLSPPTPPRSVSVASSSALVRHDIHTTTTNNNNNINMAAANRSRSTSNVDPKHVSPPPPSSFIPAVSEADNVVVTSPFLDAALRRMKCGSGTDSNAYATVYDIQHNNDVVVGDAPLSRSYIPVWC